MVAVRDYPQSNYIMYLAMEGLIIIPDLVSHLVDKNIP